MRVTGSVAQTGRVGPYADAMCSAAAAGLFTAVRTAARALHTAHSLSRGRQWNLILLARWMAHWSRGTSCLGLMPRMMSCSGQQATMVEQAKDQLGP